jgi:hypothetical protein
MKIRSYKRYTGEWILVNSDNSRVACAKKFYENEAEARTDISRVLADLEIAAEKAIDDILAHLRNEL